jgi:acyl dehydratase
MKVMALLLRDPNPIHFDHAALHDLGLGERVINQGPIGIGYIMNMLAAWSGDARRLLTLRCRFMAQVFEGDGLTVGGEVAQIDPRGEGDLDVACRVWIDNDLGVRVLEGTATVRLPSS